MAPELLTAPAVAALLSVTDETVRKWADQGKIAYITLPSGARRFRRADIDAILAGGADAPAEAAS